MIMLHLRESGHLTFRATSALDRGSLKTRKGTDIDSLHRGSYDSRVVVSHNHFRQPAQCLRSDVGLARNSFASSENPVSNMNDESECRISARVVSLVTNPPSTNVPIQGNLLRSHDQRFETLPEDMRVIEASQTFHDFDDGFGSAGSCREYKLPRSDELSTPKGLIRGNTKIGSVLEVKITYHLYQYGIKIRVETLMDLKHGL